MSVWLNTWPVKEVFFITTFNNLTWKKIVPQPLNFRVISGEGTIFYAR